ncbi:MAG: DUF3656 domain-containing protein [Clostridia bacterium]
MELLSPAGSFASFNAAVQNGADAVYVGGTRFNARINAANLSDEELKIALTYAKPRGVKVFVVLNTLILDREMNDALNYAEFLYSIGVDAVIIQDLGLISKIKKYIPGLEMHASTQMGISDLNGVLFCEKLGISRVVLAREVSLIEISGIKAHTDVEIEVFAHGAMCMSYSGACLFSSIVGGRSGNRGRCAQPCRKIMDFQSGTQKYALSMADMCMIQHLDEIEKSGVCSIKLEGRMKSPEYVALITNAYRRALDGAPKLEIEELKRKMFAIFNRGEFTTGYYFGDRSKTNRRADKNVSESVLKEASLMALKEDRKSPVDIYFRAAVNEKAKLTLSMAEKSVTVFGAEAETARSARSSEYYKNQLQKLGKTPFIVKNINLCIDENAYLSVSAINELRRNAVEELIKKCVGARKELIPFEPNEFSEITVENNSGKKPKHIGVIARVCSVENIKTAFYAGADEVVYAPNSYNSENLNALLEAKPEGKKLILYLPVAIIAPSDEINIKKLIDSGVFDGAEINNFGEIILADALPYNIGGAHLNVFNSFSLKALLDLGLSRVHMSVELNRAQLKYVAKAGKAEMFVHGRIPLMQLFHCPLREHGSKKCEGQENCVRGMKPIYDEDGRVFPLKSLSMSKQCVVSLYNCVSMDIIDKIAGDIFVDAIRLDFTFEDAVIITERIRSAKIAIAGKPVLPLENITRGHYFRGVE